MPFAHNGDARLHWDEKGAGTPLLLVMGHRFSSRMWYPVIDALAARHRVIWFDNRGTGESSSEGATKIAQFSDDALLRDGCRRRRQGAHPTASRWAA